MGIVAEEEENESGREPIKNKTITTHNNLLWSKKERKSNQEKQQARTHCLVNLLFRLRKQAT